MGDSSTAAEVGVTTKGVPGKRMTILSIDGGGMRGVIPATILEFLEEQLQILDGPNVRIADYFDVIAGTSTGGLIGGILSAPDEKGRPRYNAKDIMKFYVEEGPKIFAKRFLGLLSRLVGPNHDATALESILEKNLKDLRMKDTVTELFIPTFDIKLMQPTYFSTTQAKQDESKNAFVRDVLRGTTAAPTYFSPYFFSTTTSTGSHRSFNLIDGGVGMNNPAHLSILQTWNESSKSMENDFSSHALTRKDFQNVLLLSLGTGKVVESYSAEDAAKWGVISWVLKDGHNPLFDIVSEASADMVDYNLSRLFSLSKCSDNYLRIQAFDIPKNVAKLDNSTKENTLSLQEIGKGLLEMQVKEIDIESGAPLVKYGQETNKDALKRFAKELSKEYQAKISEKK